MEDLLRGAIVMAFSVIAAFFVRFWRETRDRLFGLFALAFMILAVNRVGLTLAAVPYKDSLYWVRFAAFAVILFAIWDKNRTKKIGP